MTAKILIVDDHGVLRAGLHALLNTEPDMEVVGVSADGKEALAKAVQLQPDLVLMDISLGEMDGIEVTRQLHQVVPGTKVLILTFHEDINFLQQAVEAGVSGYILKKASMNELICAIQAVVRGELYIYPALTRGLLAQALDLKGPKQSCPSIPLSQREIEVMQLIVRGYTNIQISQRLDISFRTVEYHRRNIMCKLNIETRDQLVKYANEHMIS